MHPFCNIYEACLHIRSELGLSEKWSNYLWHFDIKSYSQSHHGSNEKKNKIEEKNTSCVNGIMIWFQSDSGPVKFSPIYGVPG